MVATTVAYPFELAYKRQIMSIDRPLQPGMISTIKEAYRHGSLFRGLTLCYIRNALFYLIFPFSLINNKAIE